MPSHRCKGVTLKERRCKRRLTGPKKYCGRCQGKSSYLLPAYDPLEAELFQSPYGDWTQEPADPNLAERSWPTEVRKLTNMVTEQYDRETLLEASIELANMRVSDFTYEAGRRLYRSVCLASDMEELVDELAEISMSRSLVTFWELIAKDSELPTSIRSKILEFRWGADRDRICRSLLQNGRLTLTMIRHLAEEYKQDYAMQIQIAGHPKTSPQILKQLALSSSPAVRTSVAENRNTPIECLRRLGKHLSPERSLALVGNDATPPDVIFKITSSLDPTIRLLAAVHPNAGHSTLLLLSFDSDERVAQQAAQNLANHPDS